MQDRASGGGRRLVSRLGLGSDAGGGGVRGCKTLPNSPFASRHELAACPPSGTLSLGGERSEPLLAVAPRESTKLRLTPLKASSFRDSGLPLEAADS